MKNFLLIAFLIGVFASGCAKKEMGCTPVSPQSEEPQILAYASTNGITAVKHSSGMYYQIIKPGSGTTVTNQSNITVGYVGKLLNNSVFDQSSGYTNQLGGLIEGWQIGIPLIKKGGEIKLIIPSSLAYGCTGAGVSVPSNSVLYFDITLIDVQ